MWRISTRKGTDFPSSSIKSPWPNLQSVSFTYNCTNVDCIPVMKEVLVRRKNFYIRYPSAQEYLWNITIFTLLILKQHTRVSVHYESILFMAVNIAPSTSV